MSVGSRLKRAREKKKLSQIDVYEKTNINNKTLSRYEKDGAEPDYDTLRTLAKLYGVTISYFFEEEGANTEHDLEELLKDKQLTWGDQLLSDEEKKKAIEILNILLDHKKKDTTL